MELNMASTLYQSLNLTKEHFIEQLQKCFDQDESLPTIAKQFNTSSTTIMNWSRKLSIKRSRANTLRDKSWLFHKYITEKKNMAEIAELIGVTYQSVAWWLEKHQIPKRALTEVQQMANSKRPYTNLHTDLSFKSRGYCGWYKDIFYYRSINELVWYMLHEYSFQSIKSEPFVINNYKPDFLINENIVIEIKGKIDNKIIESYGLRSKPLLDRGYEFKIVFVQSEFPIQYNAVRYFLVKNKSTPGVGFNVSTNVLL